MQERLRELWNRITDWWKKLTTRQRTLIVSAAAAVLLAFVVLFSVLSQPQYTLLANCESTKEASEITTLLDGENIGYKVSDDGLQIRVETSSLSKANLLLGANNITSESYSIDNVTSGGLSTTEADKRRRHVVYLEKQLANDFIGMFPAIKKAVVQLHIPEDDGTLISSKQESYATIVLDIQGDFTADNATFLAKAIATALGNDTTKNITIIDSAGNMLFSGSDEYSLSGIANSQLSVKRASEEVVADKIKGLLQGTNGFDVIEVAVSLDIDFSTKQITDHDYTSDENSTQGLLAEAHKYNSESTSGGGDVPGTDSNDEGTTYVLPDNSNQSTSVTEEDYKYVPNESVTQTSIPAGTIQYSNSSAAVTAIDYIIVKEEDAKAQGLLEGMTWDEYKAANNERTRIEIDEDLIDNVAKGSLIPSESISIVAYQENWFVDAEGMSLSTSDIIMYALIALILGLLVFVILRTLASDKKGEEPVEEELSVETILQSTPEPELDDIELETKSETRLAIEKFVDSNPEAAAILLRNWLNEDWG